MPLFDRKEHKKRLLLETDIDVIEDTWDIKEPHDLIGCTEELYQYVWEKYVDIPENECFNSEAHEALKEKELSFFHKGGIVGKIKNDMLAANDPVRCPKCGSKSISTQQGFNKGKAVAGALVVGAAGAVIAGADSKPMNFCQSCGHKWNPSK